MSILTTATRMWLTRSLRPFQFTDKSTDALTYDDCKCLGLYIHIPFCQNLCSFCPYCKVTYQQDICESYINHLIEEIHMVGRRYAEKKAVTSLYFGGGSPALALDRLQDILTACEEHFIIHDGIGLELHPENVTVPILTKLKEVGVTKISIGIQSFQEKSLSLLGRSPCSIATMQEALSAVSFDTVSMDFIFALPGQTIHDLKADIAQAAFLGANHIAVYPFIDFSFTNSQIPPLKKDEKRKLLDDLTLHFKHEGYTRDSIWTFAKDSHASYSSMTRDTFLGFGCSATTLLRHQFKINTFSIEGYENKIRHGHLPSSLTIQFTPRQRMLYYLFWTAYSTRVDAGQFFEFFKLPLKKMYGFELWIGKKLGLLTEKDGHYKMTPKGVFYYHYYENFYTLAYIDKMWGIMRNEAFPKRIEF